MEDGCAICGLMRTRKYGDRDVMECRANSPSTSMRQGQKAQWPEVEPTDWCGKFVAKPSPLEASPECPADHPAPGDLGSVPV